MPAGIYFHKIGKESAHWKGGKPKCIDCGTRLGSYGIKRCRKCWIVQMKLNPPRKGIPNSKEFRIKISKALTGRKLPQETIQKLKDAQRKRVVDGRFKNQYGGLKRDKGELKKRDERNDPAYQKWVKDVKKRDKNQCIFKGQDCFGYNIVHHILGWSIFPELRYEINNGITLCQYHHPRKKAEEQRLIPFFREMVESKELI